MKKRYVLKQWVKEVIFGLVMLAMLVLCFIGLNETGKDTDKAIDACMEYGGSTYETCWRGVHGY